MNQTLSSDDFSGHLENLKYDPSPITKRNVFQALLYQQPWETPADLQLVAEALRVNPDEIQGEYSSFIAAVAQERANQRPAATLPKAKQASYESLSDSGNSRRLVTLYGGLLRFCHALNRWLIWTGDHWQIDEDGSIFQYARAAVQTIYGEANNIQDTQERREHAKFALRSESEKALKAMIGLARSEPETAIRRERLDAPPFKLNLANGILDLETGELLEHDPIFYFSKILPWAFDIEEEAPRWMQFLDEITGSNNDLKAYLQQIAGYCLTASTREQVFFIFWGDGRNGKSTFVKMLLELLGPWAAQTPAETLVQRKGTGGHNDLARLADKRLVAAIETEEGGRLAESLIKTLTGNDRIAARRLYEENFEYEPGFKVILTTNCVPRIRETTMAIWRRVRLVPFTWTIPEDQIDLDLEKKLKTELPGILTWAVKGCFEWLNHGKLETPEIVKRAIHEYQQDQDQVSRFIADCCETGGSTDSEQARKLFTKYQEWVKASGEWPYSEKRFGKRLAELGYKKEHRANGTFYFKIRLTDFGGE